MNVNGEHKYNLHNYFSPHTGSRWARPGQVTMHSVKLRGPDSLFNNDAQRETGVLTTLKHNDTV